MRNGQNKRMRGRNNNNNNNRKNHNPLTRVYESNGPDVKIRGTASHVAEKYIQLARDAQSSGDPVAAENYYQHAEHYFRLIAAAQEQFRQATKMYRPEGSSEARNDDAFDGDDEGVTQPHSGGHEPHYAPRDNAQPYQQGYSREGHQPYPRDQQNYQPREQYQQGHHANRDQNYQPRPQPSNNGAEGGEAGLPSFITGQQGQPQIQGGQGGHDNYQDRNQGDRYPMHRRRRRHRGPRDMQGGGHVQNEMSDDSAPRD
ncbi:MAG: DUF4167 domain-containing protein [Pseudorhodoplanes sp.]